MTAVVLKNPKYVENVGNVLRACACFGVDCLIITGNRFREKFETLKRSPRAFRMKDYNISIVYDEEWWKRKEFTGCTFIAVENRQDFQDLREFDHPEKAVYLFGPEDGNLNRHDLQHCSRFVEIDTLHSLNLAHCVSLVLYSCSQD